MSIDRLAAAISIVARGPENLHTVQTIDWVRIVLNCYEKWICEFSTSGIRPDRRTGKIPKSFLHALSENTGHVGNIFAADV